MRWDARLSPPGRVGYAAMQCRREARKRERGGSGIRWLIRYSGAVAAYMRTVRFT